MVIQKSAIEDFINQPLDDWDWLKEVPERLIDDELDLLNPRPKFYTEPMLHQKVAFLIGATLPEFLYLLDLGTGKTKLMLDILAYYKQLAEPTDALALVPNAANIENWVMEVETHRPDLTIIPMYGSTTERLELLEYDADLHIVNYQGLIHMMTMKVPRLRGQKGNRLVLDPKRIGWLSNIKQRYICDESSAFKNSSSLTFKILNKATKPALTVFELTGTPIGRDPMDFWAQFFILDRGKTLGPNMTWFREIFFKKKKGYWTKWIYHQTPHQKDMLNRFIKNRSIFYDESECSTLPEKVMVPQMLPFPKEFETEHKRLHKKLQSGYLDYSARESTFHSMRMVTSGYMSVNKGDKVEYIPFSVNPKMEALLEIVHELPPGRKLIIYHEYVFTGDLIAKQLRMLKIGLKRLDGSTKNQPQVLRQFRENKNFRILLANNNSGAFGLNLQVANYTVFYESPVSPIVRRQAEKRTHRGGQKYRTFIFDLTMKNTVDVRIMSFLKEGKNLFDALVKRQAKMK